MEQLRPGKSKVTLTESGNSTEAPDFASEFRRHIAAGTRPNQNTAAPPRVWTPTTFCDAIGNTGLATRPSTRTFSNWCEGKYAPRTAKMMDAIEKVLWGGNTECADCKRLRELWENRAPGQASSPRPAGDPASPLVARSSRKSMALALLDMTTEAAPQGSTADDFEAIADMRHGVEPFEDVGGNVTIGLSRVTVRYEESGCQPKGRRYGDDGKTDGVNTIAGGWEFTAKPSEVLHHHFVQVLARFQCNSEADKPSVTFHASGHTDDLKPLLDGEIAKLPGKAKGILAQYLVKKCYPRKGIIALGSASVRWVHKQ